MFRLGTFLFVLASLVAAQQPPPAPAAAPLFRISGTVVNAAGGGSLSQTTVQIASVANPNAVQTFTTAEDGKFFFENLPRGKYALTARRRGFRDQSFDEHGFFSTAIAVGPDLNSENLVFRLNPDAEISGKITEDGDPVPNGQVSLFYHAPDDELQATHFLESRPIDDQGNYHFGHLLAGTYFVAVTAEPWYAQHQFSPAPPPVNENAGTGGVISRLQQPQADPKLDVVFPLTLYENATEISSATPIVVHPGEKYQADISLHAVPALRLRVHMKVDDPAQAPSLSATEGFMGMPGQISHGTMQRIGDEVELVGLPPGHLLLNVQGQGTSRQKELNLSGDTEINLDEKPPASPLTGTISFAAAETPPQNVWVMLNNRKSGTTLNAPVARDGSFTIQQRVPPGSYQVYVNNAPGYVPDRISAVGARVVGQTLQIKSDAAVQLSISTSRQLGRVDGTAFFADKPFAGAMIILVPGDVTHNATLFRRDQSDSDGTFTLPGIVPGKYTLIAIRDAWETEWSNPALLSRYMAAGQQIEVAANGKYTAKVNVQSVR